MQSQPESPVQGSTFDKKIIAVVGATGSQGGSLVRAILSEGDKSEFVARALTRNPSSDKAQWLKKCGAQVVQADVNDEESLMTAIDGCYGMYCVTFFGEHLDPDEELRQAKNMAAAAKKKGVKHAIWSTLEDSRIALDEGTRVPTMKGKYKVPTNDAKGEADQFFAEIPTTYLVTSFYWDNFIHFGFAPKKIHDSKYVLALPLGNKRVAGIAAEDIGKCALGVFKHPYHFINKRVGIMAEALTGTEIAEKMSRALGKDISYQDVGIDEFRQLGIPGVNDLANMFMFYQDCEEQIIAGRNVAETHKLNPDVMTLDQWLSKYKDYIPIGV